MAEVRWVGPPSSGLGGRPRLLGGIVVALLAVLVIKPWGTSSDRSGDGARPSPLPTTEPSPVASHGFDPLHHYDPAIFGIHEPAPGWAIWPAGYLVTFGFVIQVSGAPPASAPPASAPSGSKPPGSKPPGSKPPSSPRPSIATAAPDDGAWPASFVIPDGNHLFLIGINMPTGIELSAARLERTDVVGENAVVPITRLLSPWPAHFAVLGVDDGAGGLKVWDSGDYRLDVVFQPGSIGRTVEIGIGRPAGD